MNYFIDALQNYATFTGRATRTQYWMYTLFYIIFYVATLIADGVTGTYNEDIGMGPVSGMYVLALLIPTIAITVRRLHDIGFSGWWLLLWLIPVVGIIAVFIFTVIDSSNDESIKEKYGISPKHLNTDTQAVNA